MIGKTISQYKILEEIGSGGMGVVYKAEDTKLKRTVALKFLSSDLTRDKAAKDRLLHEARAAAALEHSNICPVYEINETPDGQMYMVMAFYEGETLKDKMTSGPLLIAETINIIYQIADGLNKAHQKDIIHRDIKPANIMITEEGKPKILDFGLAKLRGQTKLTKEGTTLGTVAYMSPEQTTGEEVDQRTDIWSLGVMFYEMIAGQLPFKGHYEQAIVYSILNEEPESISKLVPDVPSGLEEIVNRMMEKDPAKRYQTMAEILGDFKRFIKESSAEIAALKLIPQPVTGLKPIYRSVIVLIVALIVVIAGTFILKKKPELSIQEPEGKPSIAILYFENDSNDKTLDVWRAGLAKLLITDLSQSKYVDVVPTDKLYSVLKKLNLLEARNYSTEDLLKIGKQAEVNHVLTSSFIKMGETFAITAQLKNLETDQVVHAFRMTAKNENDIFPRIDDMTREIKVHLNLTDQQLATDIDQSIIDVTTSNPEALKHFIEGEKLHHIFKHGEAIKSLKLAIELDPDFAMAYEILSACLGNTGKLKESHYYGKKAVELKDRLPIKERYIIEASYYFNQERYDLAIEKLQELIDIYPDHANARHRLGMCYSQVGEWEKSIELIKPIKNKQPLHYNHFKCYYSNIGDYEKVRQVANEEFIKLKNFEEYAWQMANAYVLEGQYDLARDWYIKCSNEYKDEKKKKQQDNMWIGVLEFYRGNFSLALKLLGDLGTQSPIYADYPIFIISSIHLTKGQIQETISNYDKAYHLCAKPQGVYKRFEIVPGLIDWLNLKGSLYIRLGKVKEALKLFKHAHNLIPEEGVWSKRVWMRHKREHLFNLVLCYTEMGELEKAEAIFKELRQTIPDCLIKNYPRTEQSLWLLLLRGGIELKRKNLLKAIDILKKAETLFVAGEITDWDLKNTLVLNSLAQAYTLDENVPEAIHTYEKITRLTMHRVEYGDLYAKSFLHLGKLYQKQGENEKAIQNYKKFIDLWKECDPEFQPLVEDAKKRLGELAPSQE